MYVHLVALTVTGRPAVTDGLDGDLARLSTMTAPGGWTCSRTRGGLRRPAGAASCPGVRASAAAAVRCRGKASGRRLVRRVPRRARTRSPSAVCASSAAVGACAVTRRQAHGALRAPLKTYREFSPIGQHPLSTSRHARLSLVGRLLWDGEGRQEPGNMCLRLDLMHYFGVQAQA